MFCPRCNTFRDNEYAFCTECGAPLLTAKPKKGSLWPPLIFMVLMVAVGIAVFLLYPEERAVSETPWFTVEDGSLRFDAALYGGSPELTVLEGVTALADGCFSDCDTLTTVLLPDSLTAIGDRAFAQCDQLRGVKLPENVTVIGADAFLDCAALEALTVPATVTSIGSGAFDGCGALRHIFFEGTKQQWQALNTGSFGTQTTIYCVDGTISGVEAEP